jgi:hypothetical protein
MHPRFFRVEFFVIQTKGFSERPIYKMKVPRIVSLLNFLVLLSVFTGCGGFKGVVTPTLTAISPSTVAAGSQGFTLTATGTNFVSGTQILWNGIAQTTKVVSNTQLTTVVSDAQIASAGDVTIRVIKPDTTTSGAMTLTITGSASQSFSLTSINPYTVAAGSPAFTLTAIGVGFANGDSITLNGTAIATTFDSATQLHATVPATNVATVGTIQVGVQDASNNKTNQLPFVVTGGAAGIPPTLTSLNPNTSYNNVASVTLAANGTGFVSGSVIVWNGTAMPTTFVSSTQLTTTIPGTFLTIVGTENVFVLNPDSTVSNTLPFTLTANPATTPTLTNISPTKSAVGDPGFTLTLNGTNFAPGCVAYFGATALPTTVVSSMQLTALVPASALTAVAEIQVTAKNTQSNPSNPIPYLVGMNIFFGEVNDLIWDPARNIMYISQPSTSSKNPNTVVAIDPISLAIQWTYSPGSGSEPDHLALSADKKYLYVGLDGKGTIERLILGNQQGVPDISIPLGSDPNLGPYYAMDVEVDPVQSSTIAVARGVLPSVSIIQAAGGVAIYDNATQRPSIISPTTQAGNVLLDTIQWSNDGTSIYAANNENFEGDFYQLSVSASGVSLVSDHLNFFPVPNLRIHLDPTTQLLYGDDGLVVNPSTAAETGNFVSSGVMVTDATLNHAYFVGQSSADIQTVAYEVESFNLTNFSAVAQLQLYQVNGLPQHIVRWGSNGLAFATKKVTNCIVSPCTIQDGRMYVIYGPFVTQ